MNPLVAEIKETDYKIQSILRASSITNEAYEELRTKTKADNTTNEEHAAWKKHIIIRGCCHLQN